MAGENDFIYQYFIAPIINYSGYNPVNTLAYALIAIVICFFVIYPALNKRKIKFDYNFAISVLPYVIFGSAIRILEERHSAVHLIGRSPSPLDIGFYFLSPGIYIMVACITVASLLISLKIGKIKKINPLKIFRSIGMILVIPLILWYVFNLTHPEALASIAVATSLVTCSVYFIFKKAKHRLFDKKINILVLAGQVLDGAATSIILQFYPVYREQHFLSNAIIQTFGPFAFLLTKTLVAIIIIYFIDRMAKSKEITGNFAGFIKIMIIILGFATGTRDMLSVALTMAI